MNFEEPIIIDQSPPVEGCVFFFTKSFITLLIDVFVHIIFDTEHKQFTVVLKNI